MAFNSDWDTAWNNAWGRRRRGGGPRSFVNNGSASPGGNQEMWSRQMWERQRRNSGWEENADQGQGDKDPGFPGTPSTDTGKGTPQKSGWRSGGDSPAEVQTMEDRIRTAQDTSYLPKFARSGRFGNQLQGNRMRGLQRMTGSMFRGTEGLSQHNTRPTGGRTYPPGHGQSEAREAAGGNQLPGALSRYRPGGFVNLPPIAIDEGTPTSSGGRRGSRSSKRSNRSKRRKGKRPGRQRSMRRAGRRRSMRRAGAGLPPPSWRGVWDDDFNRVLTGQ